MDIYEQSIEEANRFAGGAYADLKGGSSSRSEWWGFKNGYIQGYRAAQAEVCGALGIT